MRWVAAIGADETPTCCGSEPASLYDRCSADARLTLGCNENAVLYCCANAETNNNNYGRRQCDEDLRHVITHRALQGMKAMVAEAKRMNFSNPGVPGLAGCLFCAPSLANIHLTQVSTVPFYRLSGLGQQRVCEVDPGGQGREEDASVLL
ncbi:hypothetical protein O9K51_03298 [Purpureocillium lavendulum]|uniref:Hydrophobin n=1 Tax=Purpureocillium lavendulum TaxID=1247861 RepID=A0AB34FZT2_9HYPO|nr:hypothetical protein O9K51_03298 [Purpureocillium lavendulum]